MEAPPLTFSLLFWLLFFRFSISSAAQCNPNEKKVLLEIKTKLNPTNLAFSDWDPTATPDCCDWFGIQCSTSARVTSLNLNLDVFVEAQHIPPVIGELPFLQSLHIHGNLTGPIPGSIANLANLQTLELSSGLTGPIPKSLGRLKRLTSLDLSLNILTGSIPSTLGQLTGLTYLDLSNNKLSSSIPDSLGRLTALNRLDLSSNRLTGPIPASLSNLIKITRLDLGANRISGSIPANFGSFKNPGMDLFLGQNQLSGPIPRSFGKAIVNLLDLSMNQLTGDASFLFGSNKTALETIYLNHNHFKFDFSNVDLPMGIRDLDIQHNEIYGSLPKRLGQLRLRFINVSDNRLCGMIPTGRRIKHVSPDNFAHNKCLCGVPLPPCK